MCTGPCTCIHTTFPLPSPSLARIVSQELGVDEIVRQLKLPFDEIGYRLTKGRCVATVSVFTKGSGAEVWFSIKGAEWGCRFRWHEWEEKARWTRWSSWFRWLRFFGLLSWWWSIAAVDYNVV